MPDFVVLDCSALLAFTRAERGGSALVAVLEGSPMSTINASEAHEPMLRDGAEPGATWNGILNLGCEICPFTTEQGQIAADRKAIV